MIFSAELTEVKLVCNVLKAIAIKEFAIFRPLEEGLKVTLDEMQCIETSAYIPSNIFTKYQASASGDVMFKINLKTFTDILNIFGDEVNPALKLTLSTANSPLCMIMNSSDEHITIDCEIRTLNITEAEHPSLAEECNLNKIVVSANIFVEILQKLDNASDDLQIIFKETSPYFTMKCKGLSGEAEVSLNKHSESVVIYQCQQDTDFTYAFSNIRHILKVLHQADKVSLFNGESGLLGWQLVINSEEKHLYVEYYVTSQYMAED